MSVTVIKLSRLLELHVEAEDGTSLGHVHDVRVRRVDGRYVVEGLIVGPRGLLVRLGWRRARGRAPLSPTDVVRWQDVVALEPERAPTLYRARAAGAPVDVDVSGIAADSLGAKRIGAIAWDVTQRHLADALLLDDEAIRAAQQWLWRELHLAVEPAAALGVAALQTGAYRPLVGEKVCLVLCGANFDPATALAA